MAQNYEEIAVELKDHVEVITLNDPDHLNPFTFPLLYEMVLELDRAELDDDVRCVVFTGAGKGFCSGADLRNAATEMPIYMEKLGFRRMTEHPGSILGYTMRRIGEFRKPTIAAVNGVAVGAGFSLALACDIRIAAEEARFATIFSKRAMVVHAGMAYHLPRIVGMAKALEMTWTDDFVHAEEAKEIGLVSSIYPRDQLMTQVLELAGRIAAGPSITLELDKQLLWRAGQAPSIMDGLQLESWASSVANGTEDAQEGMKSFMERRDPIFQGR